MIRRHVIMAIALVAAILIGSAMVYPSLPEQIPTHWNVHGRIDAYGSKSWAVFLMPGLMIAMLGLSLLLPSMSPVSFKLDTFRATYGYIIVVVLGLFAYIQVAMLIAASRPGLNLGRVLIPGIFVGLALLGNVLGKVRRNYFVGVRVPWTLASERVWNETHRLAAWLLFAAGLLGALIALAGYPLGAMTTLVPALVTPILFSFVRYKQLERRGEV